MYYSAKVRQFTEESGVVVPREPRTLSDAEIQFNIRMVLSEAVELLQTYITDFNNCLEVLKSSVALAEARTRNQSFEQTVTMRKIHDACVELALDMNVDLYLAFLTVHEANMAKRFPDGKFHRRESDGKIIKPEGWCEPNIDPNDCRIDSTEPVVELSEDQVRRFMLDIGLLVCGLADTATVKDSNFVSRLLDTVDIKKDVIVKNRAKEQIDALVDVIYYNLNTACKAGIALD